MCILPGGRWLVNPHSFKNATQGGERMISAWWLLLAFTIGAWFGVFLIALVSVNRPDDRP